MVILWELVGARDKRWVTKSDSFFLALYRLWMRTENPFISPHTNETRWLRLTVKEASELARSYCATCSARIFSAGPISRSNASRDSVSTCVGPGQMLNLPCTLKGFHPAPNLPWSLPSGADTLQDLTALKGPLGSAQSRMDQNMFGRHSLQALRAYSSALICFRLDLRAVLSYGFESLLSTV